MMGVVEILDEICVLGRNLGAAYAFAFEAALVDEITRFHVRFVWAGIGIFEERACGEAIWLGLGAFFCKLLRERFVVGGFRKFESCLKDYFVSAFESGVAIGKLENGWGNCASAAGFWIENLRFNEEVFDFCAVCACVAADCAAKSTGDSGQGSEIVETFL